MISRLFSRPDDAVGLVELTRLARRYAVEQQQVPRDLIDLVALNYLPAVPASPEGHQFVIDRKRVEVKLEALPGLAMQPGMDAKRLEPR